MTRGNDIVLASQDVCIDYVQRSRFWRKAPTVRAIDVASFEIHRGESIGVIGRNGAGKSTLLRALAGIIRPTSGSISRFTDSITLLALGVGYEPTSS